MAVNLSRIAHLVSLARAQSLRDWRYLGIAVKELAIARLRHAIQPASQIILDLQHLATAEPRPTRVAVDTQDLARRSRAIGHAAAIVPWRSDCLPQAMAAGRWLRRDNLRPEFHLGVAKDEAANCAHTPGSPARA